MLNITTHKSPHNVIYYAKAYLGNPEVIFYSEPDLENDIRYFYIYSEQNKNYIKTTSFYLKDLIPLLRPGDVLGYTGHTILVYDVERDSDGNVIDAFIIESSILPYDSFIQTKIPEKTINGQDGDIKDFHGAVLFLTSKENNCEDGLTDGGLKLNRLSQIFRWPTLNYINDIYYAVLRYVNKDSKGNAILTYRTWNPEVPYKYDNGDIINLTDKDIDRTKKFKRLYIEKIVNKYDRNTVILGDILNYKIIIRNMWKYDYNYDLIVTENISEFVTYESHIENKSVISFNYDKKKRQIIWNIGKLKKKEEVILNYLVRVTSGKLGDIIESTGRVSNIPTSVVRNYIGINLNNNQMKSIKNSFEKLKNKYNGKKLINEIYKNSLNKDIQFDKFDITQLINNTDIPSTFTNTLELNKNHIYYRAILNKYWSVMVEREYLYDKNKEKAVVNTLKYFKPYNDLERRKDFIIEEDFKTGDILLYININDFFYIYDENNNIVTKDITYEDGEYAYIYIEGKGFVGTNLGNDGIKNTKDDRNEFNAQYYKDHNLPLYQRINKVTQEQLEMANLQTLLGKNYYVILRPSLCFDFPEKISSNIILIFLLYMGIIIIALGLLILWKYINMKKKGKEFNFNNLKNELLFSYKTNQ